MGSDDEFKALAEAAFAKMIMKPREEVLDSRAPEFTQLVAFLDESDQREEFLRKLVKVCTKRFSRERGPESSEFLVTCSGDPEVFNVGYGGFWLLSLLDAGKETVTTSLQSFKIGRLGPVVYMGVWGDQEILGRWIPNLERWLILTLTIEWFDVVTITVDDRMF